MSNSTPKLQTKNYADQLSEFEKNISAYKEKQISLVKENPYIEITDHNSYEQAKKHRTALLKGRTGLKSEETFFKKILNGIKSYGSEKITELISYTEPHEKKQDAEVKRYEQEREAKRLEKEREAEKIKQEAIANIDVVFEEIEGKIDQMKLKDIAEIEVNFTTISETNVSEDLQIYFDTKLKSAQNKFLAKEDNLKNQQELHENKQKNLLLELVNKWSTAIFEAKAHNILELNQVFDQQIPSLEADDYEPFQESFNESMKSLRDKLVEKTSDLKKEVEKEQKRKEEEAKAEGERLEKQAIKDTIQKKYEEAKTAIEKYPLYGKDSLQKVEEKILLLETEANNIEFSKECKEKIIALQSMLKLRVFEVKEEKEKEEQERKKKEDEEAKALVIEAKEKLKKEDEKKGFLKKSKQDYLDLIDLKKGLRFEASQIPEFETEEGSKAYKKISRILEESKDDMEVVINSIMRR